MRSACLRGSRVGRRPKLVQAGSEQMQSQFVCQKILELREEGVPLWDIAVLFRSSFHSFDLEIELARHNIPFIKRGGFQFMETSHVKDLLAHLRVLANPQDAVSWNRILMLLEGVGPGASQKIIKWLLDGSNAVERLRSYSSQRQDRPRPENSGAGARRGGAGGIAVRAGAISSAILCADPEAKLSRRSSQASARHGALSRHDRALSQPGAFAQRHGAGTAQR